MHQIREVLRLNLGLGLTQRQTAKSLGIARGTVSDIVQRAHAEGVGWPVPMDLKDIELERLLFPGPRPGRPAMPDPDFNWMRHELLKDKDVTLQLLWYEYKAQHPADGLQYSQFCRRYREWEGRLDIVLRIPHVAGDKVFVDFAGRKQRIIDPITGEVWYAPLFVGVLGASSYLYAELLPDETEGSVCMAMARMFAFFKGVPALIVPDNMKTAVTKSSRYEPEISRSFAAMAAHFGCAVLPTRVRKPRDKAKVEVGVQVAQRWLLAALRNRTFFSLAEANAAVVERRDWINQRPFRKLEGSRSSVFATIEKPVLRPLPELPYVFTTYTRARVGLDCHVQFDHCYYSAPHTLVGKELELRVTDTTVTILFDGEQVAGHARRRGRGLYATVPAHLPESHRRHLEWNPQRLIAWGKTIGPMLGQLIEEILKGRTHPEQGYRSCLGIMHLAKIYPPARMEAAATRALTIGARSARSMRSILENRLDQEPLADENTEPTPDHGNVRGADYYGKVRAKR
ncbi:MAG: IS21 family transposase [Thermaerobacter sp.]|nr:IS21 family transposase [Thermaerobacter sp.]